MEEEVQTKVVSEKITSLLFEINKLKCEVEKDFVRKYVTCFPLLTSFKDEDVSTLMSSLEKQDKELQQLVAASLSTVGETVNNLSNNVTSAMGECRMLKLFIEADNLIKKSTWALEEPSECDWLTVAEDLYQTGKLLELLDKNLTNISSKPLILEEMEERMQSLQNRVQTHTEEKWDELVSWKEIQQGKKGKHVYLKVFKASIDITNVYKILSLIKPEITSQAYNLANKLMKEILKPLIKLQCSSDINLEVQETFNCNILSFRYKFKEGKITKKANLFKVIEDIISVFQFICNNLDIDSCQNTKFLTTVGSVISSEMASLLIEEQIDQQISEAMKENNDIAAILDAVKHFKTSLIKFGFISEDSNLFQEYEDEPQLVLRNKLITIQINKAKELMKMDLHNAITVGPLSSFSCSDNKKFENSSFISDSGDGKKWIFPKCQISKWILKLISLVENCINEAKEADYSYALTFINTVRLIFTLFTTVVPKMHRPLLNSIPQQSGYLYNNAMYLSHFILINENKMRAQLPAQVASLPISLVDHVPQLVSMGFNELNNQVMLQQNFLISTLDSSGLTQLGDMEIFNTTVEKGIRQGIRQLMLLKNVWIEVLPSHIYSKVMGKLCDAFINHMIHLILGAEDIREEIANQLVKTIEIIIEKAPELFQEPKEIHRHVTSWMKLGELKHVLAGTLADIENRWAGGNGPLALEFQPSQVHHLIEALFCQSDRRRQTIALIN